MKNFCDSKYIDPVITEIKSKYTIDPPGVLNCSFILKSKTSNNAYLIDVKQKHYDFTLSGIDSLTALYHEVYDYSEYAATYIDELFKWYLMECDDIEKTIYKRLFMEVENAGN